MYRIEPGEGDWPVSEIQTQIDLSRIYHDDQCQGHIHFSAKYFRDNTKNVVDDLSSYSYPNMVTLPTYPWKNFRKPVRPSGLHVVGKYLFQVKIVFWIWLETVFQSCFI